MKKILSVLLCVLLLFTATACGLERKSVYPVSFEVGNTVNEFVEDFKKYINVYNKEKPFYWFTYKGQNPNEIFMHAIQTKYSLIDHSNEFASFTCVFDLSKSDYYTGVNVVYGFDLSNYELEGEIASVEEIKGVQCNIWQKFGETVSHQKYVVYLTKIITAYYQIYISVDSYTEPEDKAVNVSRAVQIMSDVLDSMYEVDVS